VIELSSTGNAVILCRLSSEEDYDRFVDQIQPCMALAAQYGLEARTAIIAEGMSGTRQVRPDRAGPPGPGVLEREDIRVLDALIAQGWVEHVIARTGDRLARDSLPAETLLARFADRGIGLWLSDYGRRMNYTSDSGDRTLMRIMMVVSAEERERNVRRLHAGQLNKGPLAGRGNLGGITRFGFIREKRGSLYQDPEQWPWILRAFELADVGTTDGEALSTRKVAEQLVNEGCPFDHDRVRVILKDPIYATGEYVVNVRGIAIPQDPIPLTNPVPIDRFTRVQDLLALRKGRSPVTPIGEFLLNAVDARHAQCIDVLIKERPARIKGYLTTGKRVKPEPRVYRHVMGTPACCRTGGRGQHGSFTWRREALEAPIVRELHKLATHPEILSALQ
jgi:hypothetical protein